MRIKKIIGFCLLSWILGAVAFVLNAQELKREHSSGCTVIDKGLMHKLHQRLNIEETLRGLPSRPEDINRYPYIANDRRAIYVIRLAIGISKEGFDRELQSNEQRIPQYLNELEEQLNEFYERDCGIRMQIVRDKRLYLWKTKDKEGNEIAYRPNYDKGTELISGAIGEDSYDLGIIMTGSSIGLNGQATLGGIQNRLTKADGIATSDPSTIAHELGHLLGAEHTHDNAEFSIQIEPGKGRSIMSYGISEGRTFFALPSIQAMRTSCAALQLYNEDRSEIRHRADPKDQTFNTAVEVPFTEAVPQLKKELLKPEYVVPADTYFQFYIPTNRHQEGFRYNAHLNDRVKVGESNVLQCFYEGFTEPCVMYHPRYDVPEFKYFYDNKRWQFSTKQLFHSDNFRTGVYTYVLSASHKGQHDTYLTQLKIVPAQAFRITGLTGLDTKIEERAIAGANMSISWQPCTELYGQHKVRILLSDDFGKSFKYVLADEVPNTGSWQGVWPYITIGKTDYPAYTNSARQRPIKNIRAGVIKIEVIGEVAYSLSHIAPYVMQGGETISTGGFLLGVDASKSLVFSREDGSVAPAQYLELRDRSQLESKHRLKASLGGLSQSVDVEEYPSGHILTRKWQATISGITSTYVQIIKILNEEPIEADYLRKLKDLKPLATDLYQHIGTLAYPRADLPYSQDLKRIYPTIYDESGDLKPHINQEQAESFIHLVEHFAELNDEDIVMPISGAKYYIVSYGRTYRGDKRYYVTAQPEAPWDKERLEADKSKASQWLHQEVDGSHLFSVGSHHLLLAQTLKGKKVARLERGVTWGTFSILSHDKESPRIAQASNNGRVISFGQIDSDKGSLHSHSNEPGDLTSTDFQLELVDESFDVFFETRTWMNLMANLVGNNKPSLSVRQEETNRYKITIPSGYGAERIRFSGGSAGQELELQLSGRTETYSEQGRRYQLSVPDNRYATLYLDYAVAIPKGLKAFTAKMIERPKEQDNNAKSYELKLTPIAGEAIPVRTAVIIYAEKAGLYDFLELTDRGIKPVRNNDLIGAMTEIAASSRDHSEYHYFDINRPLGALSSNATLKYPAIEQNKNIEANTAYLSIYKFNNGNYEQPNITIQVSALLNNEEDTKEETPPTNDPEQPNKPEEPITPPAPVTPEPPAPPTPEPPKPVEPITPPAPVTPEPPAPPTPEPSKPVEPIIPPTKAEDNPYEWKGFIYDLRGNIVGKGNFRSLPLGIYVINKKKYLKK